MEVILKKTFDVTTVGENKTTVLRIEDVTDYAGYGIDPTYLSGVFKVIGPGNSLLHENTDLNNPDVNNTIGFSFDTGVLPEDVDTDLPVTGQYEVSYNYRYRSIFETEDYEPFPVNSDTIRISDEYEIVPGSTIQISYIVPGGPINANVGLYNIVSITQVGGGFQDVVLDDTQSGSTFIGPTNNTFIKINAYVVESIVDVFDFNFVRPDLSIELESECDLGILTFTDNTMFPYPTVSDVREVTLKYPENTEDEIPDIVFSVAYKVVDDLYTGTWNCVLKRDVVFLLSASQNVYVDIALVEGLTHVVDCSESLCAFTECYSFLLARVDDISCHGSAMEHDRLLGHMNNITAHIVLAQLLKRCGITGYREIVSEIGQMFSRAGITGCGCPSDDGLSKKVMPIASLLPGGAQTTITSSDGSIAISFANDTYDIKVSQQTIDQLQGVDGATIYYQPSNPPPSLGKPLDFTFTPDGNVWQKNVSGTWQIKFNIIPNIQTPAPEPSSYFYFENALLNDSVGNNGDVLVLDDLERSFYRRVSGTWTKEGRLQEYYRPFQNNNDQNPLSPNLTGTSAVLYFVSDHDVILNTGPGNTYTINYVQRMVGGNAVSSLDGEEVRLTNTGVVDVTVNLNNVPAVGSLKVIKGDVANDPILIKPYSTATLKYISQIDAYVVVSLQ